MKKWRIGVYLSLVSIPLFASLAVSQDDPLIHDVIAAQIATDLGGEVIDCPFNGLPPLNACFTVPGLFLEAGPTVYMSVQYVEDLAILRNFETDIVDDNIVFSSMIRVRGSDHRYGILIYEFPDKNVAVVFPPGQD